MLSHVSTKGPVPGGEVMIKAYLQVSGVPGNSADPAHLGWIELFKLVVEPDWASSPPAGAGTAWVRPIRVYAWSMLGPHAGELHMAREKGTEFASAVLEVVQTVNNRPVVKQRLRMTTVHVMSYQLNRDPGLKKPTTPFVLVPATYSYEVGSALLTLEHEQSHAAR